ncbi:hypothetical protein ACGC1H_001295 [Rhizoctonia solani]
MRFLRSTSRFGAISRVSVGWCLSASGVPDLAPSTFQLEVGIHPEVIQSYVGFINANTCPPMISHYKWHNSDKLGEQNKLQRSPRSTPIKGRDWRRVELTTLKVEPRFQAHHSRHRLTIYPNGHINMHRII